MRGYALQKNVESHKKKTKLEILEFWIGTFFKFGIDVTGQGGVSASAVRTCTGRFAETQILRLACPPALCMYTASNNRGLSPLSPLLGSL